MVRPAGPVRRLWAETSPGLRTTSLIMWATAAAGTFAGILGDHEGWWADQAFLTNLTSSLVTALFGVPLALIVIRRISAVESSRLDRAAAVQFARLTVDRLIETLAPVLRDPAEAVVLKDRLRDLDARLRTRPEHRFGPASAQVLAEWTAVANALPTAVGTGIEAADAIREAEATWRFLVLHVAPRLQIHEVAWLSRSVTDRVEVLLDRADRFARADAQETKRLAEAARGVLSQLAAEPGAQRLRHDDIDVWVGVEEQVDVLLAGVTGLVELRETVTALADGLTGPQSRT